MKNHQGSYSLRALAERCGGTVVGDPELEIRGLCSLDEPEPACLSFIKGRSAAQLAKRLDGSPIAALLVAVEAAPEELPNDRSFIRVRDPLAALVDLVPLFHPAPEPSGRVDPHAVVAPTATIAAGVTIGPFCVVGDRCVVGEGTVLHPHVVLYPDVTIGRRCTLHAGVIVREETEIGDEVVLQNGVVVGADGFGYMPDPKVGLRTVPQVGRVSIQSRVDVGANSCIDRATLGTTVIGGGSKLDNLVQVGHNVKIGKHSIVCAHTGIAGSVRIGNQVVLGGHVGVADHLTIVDGVRVGGKSGVDHDLLTRGDYAGFPLLPARRWRRVAAILGELPRLLRKRGMLTRTDAEQSTEEG
jgi:UDP-3-O-[3-hydroxymyristoyl] glucosamine N-acyltransferase